MSVKVSQSIPRAKFEQFHEILKACGGRYEHKPMEFKDTVMVAFVYDEVEMLNEHERRFALVTTDVLEVRKDVWWRILLRKVTPFRF